MLFRFIAFAAFFATTLSAAEKWYEGGTLSRATPAQWRAASNRNKLATCADFIASLWMKKSLRPEILRKIKSMDDLKPYCERLMNEIDIALVDAKDAPRVNEAAAAVTLLLGWAE